MQNQGQLISKEILLQKVWGGCSEAVDNNVEIYVSFLRKKLAAMGTNVKIITVRGLGYRLTKSE